MQATKLMTAVVILACGQALAGGMESIMVSQPNFSGFWAGVGGSYLYSSLSGRTNITKSSQVPATAQYLVNDNITNHMSPVVNAGFLKAVNSDYLAGIKGIYKYIGQEQLDQTWSGTFNDGTYQSAGLRTKFVQDFYLLAVGAYQFENWLVYAGAGPTWSTVRVDLNGQVLPVSAVNFLPVNISQSKTMIGGGGQVGFEYMLPHCFTVDISYNFSATPNQTIPDLNFQALSNNNYTTFSQRISVVEQGINITVNKYFWG